MAIASASASWDEAAFLLTIGEAETHFARYVVRPDVCLATGPAGARCDRGRAFGYWSLHRKACPAVWDLPRDDERSVIVAASCVVRLYRYARYTCGPGAGPFNLYGGRSCSDRRGQARAVRMARFVALMGH